MSKLFTAIAAVLVGTAMLSGAAFAAKGSPGPPDGGGGGPGEETAAQNLSVPAIVVGEVLGALSCGTEAAPSTLVAPTGIPLTGYELPGDWWVQKQHTWQAQCFGAGLGTVSVFGAWGDNLAGDAKLKTGSPIRVELVLTNSGESSLENMQGYKVLKLEPSKLDRESAYGHDAQLVEGGWVDTPDTFLPAEWVVHDPGMMLSVEHLASGTFPVPLQAIAPEINATGKVVYGYNLRVTAAGEYRIRFYAPSVTITGTDVPHELNDDNNAYLDIVVGGGGGGGGGPPPGKGRNK